MHTVAQHAKRQNFRGWMGGLFRAATQFPGQRLSQEPGKLFAGSGDSASGVDISPETSKNISAVFNAGVIYANAMMLPVFPYRRMSGGGRQLANDIPAWKLMAVRANPAMGAKTFRRMLEAWAQWWGNGVAEIERSRRGEPLALWPIHSSRCCRSTEETFRGEPSYKVMRENASIAYLDPADVIHVMAIPGDGLWSRSVVEFARDSLGLTRAAELYGGRFFKNDARPGGLLQYPGKIQPDAARQLRNDFEAQHTNGNVFRVGVLDQGITFSPFNMPNEAMQFLETRQFQIPEIARWYNLPPHKLKDLSRSTFSNIEHQSIEYVTDSIAPRGTVWEDEMALKLFPQAQSDTGELYARFNYNALLRGDAASRASFYKGMWEIGAYTINQILELEDMNPIGEAGDIHFVQLNMTSAEKMLRDLQKTDGETQAFLREIIKSYVQNATVSGAAANLTNLSALLSGAGVPMRPDYKQPLLPINAGSGPLLSGSVVKDEAGNAVCGDTEKPARTSLDTEDGGSEVEPEESAAVDLQEIAAKAVIEVVSSAVSRVNAKVQSAVTRAAKKYAGNRSAFVAWLDRFEEEVQDDIVQGMDTPRKTASAVVGREPPVVVFAAPNIGYLRSVRELALSHFDGRKVESQDALETHAAAYSFCIMEAFK